VVRLDEITVMIGLINYSPDLPWLCCSSAQSLGRLSLHATCKWRCL